MSSESEERARLATLPILDFPVDVSVLTNVPASTLEKLNARGMGPRLFTIGRRRKTTPEFVKEWRDRLATPQG